MKLSGNTILITAVASGIGMGFSERFVQEVNQVTGKIVGKVQH